jgi:tRNA (cmo5U34)-methyltransferase
MLPDMTGPIFSGQRATTYDDRIEQMIPGYHLMQRLTEVFFSTELPETASLLMVGAGTGAEVVECGTKHPGWSITAVDPSAEMVKLGKEKTDAAGLSRVQWLAEPLGQVPTEPPFDAATLLLVLHFLADPEKRKLLEKIAERLKPGAPFVLSTFVGNPEDTRTKRIYDLSKAHALANGLDRAEVEEKLNLNRTDIHLVSEDRIKALLRDAGFIDVQRIVQGLAMNTWIARTQR